MEATKVTPLDGGKNMQGGLMLKLHHQMEMKTCKEFKDKGDTNKKRKAKKLKIKKVQNVDEGLEKDSSDTEVFNDNDYDFYNKGKLFKKTTKEAKKWLIGLLLQVTLLNAFHRKCRQKPNESERGSDAGDSEELKRNANDSKGDESNERMRKFPRFKVAVNMDYPKFVVGKTREHHGVKWGSKILMIEHKSARTTYHRLANTTFLCKKYKNDIKKIPNWKVLYFKNNVHGHLNVNITRSHAYLTNEKAKELIEAYYMQQYRRQHECATELIRSNSGSIVLLESKTNYDRDKIFEKLYLCFEAYKDGFLVGCRPIVDLDGCHLRVRHKGKQLSAVGIVPNNQNFPIAHAVLEIENRRTWRCFITDIQKDQQDSESDKDDARADESIENAENASFDLTTTAKYGTGVGGAEETIGFELTGPQNSEFVNGHAKDKAWLDELISSIMVNIASQEEVPSSKIGATKEPVR
ncbi:hypothetical protein ACH5RR_037332 [Cinchona calisaya]|uniref:Transposase n=1 Tax=Cinchona calisaya TaxID=153742 RepID=A0ABD2Y750_9GENT